MRGSATAVGGANRGKHFEIRGGAEREVNANGWTAADLEQGSCGKAEASQFVYDRSRRHWLRIAKEFRNDRNRSRREGNDNAN